MISPEEIQRRLLPYFRDQLGISKGEMVSERRFREDYRLSDDAMNELFLYCMDEFAIEMPNTPEDRAKVRTVQDLVELVNRQDNLEAA